MAFIRKCCALDEAIVEIDSDNKNVVCGEFRNSLAFTNPWEKLGLKNDSLYYNCTFGIGDRIISVGEEWIREISQEDSTGSMVASVDDGFRTSFITFPSDAYCLDVKVNARTNMTEEIVLVLKWFPDLETFVQQTKGLVVPYLVSFCFLLPLVLIYWRIRNGLKHAGWLQFHHFLARCLCVLNISIADVKFAFSNYISYYWIPCSYFHIIMCIMYYYLLLVMYVSFSIVVAEMLWTFWTLRPVSTSKRQKKRLVIHVAIIWLLPLLTLTVLYACLFSLYSINETPLYHLYKPPAFNYLFLSCQAVVVAMSLTTIGIICKHRMDTRLVNTNRKSDVALFFKLLATTEIPAIIYMFFLETNLLSFHWVTVAFVGLTVILSSIFALIIYGFSKQHLKRLQESTSAPSHQLTSKTTLRMANCNQNSR